MKNLLLLFVLGFALFWVGCEKEAMLLPGQKGYHQNSIISDTEGRLYAERAASMEPACNCASLPTSYTSINPNANQPALINGVVVFEPCYEFTVDYTSAGAVNGENAFTELAIFLNGQQYTDGPSGVDVHNQFEAGNCTSKDYSFKIPYRRLGECPDDIDLRITTTLQSGNGMRCATRLVNYKEYDTYRGPKGTGCGIPAEPTPNDNNPCLGC